MRRFAFALVTLLFAVTARAEEPGDQAAVEMGAASTTTLLPPIAIDAAPERVSHSDESRVAMVVDPSTGLIIPDPDGSVARRIEHAPQTRPSTATDAMRMDPSTGLMVPNFDGRPVPATRVTTRARPSATAGMAIDPNTGLMIPNWTRVSSPRRSP